MNLSEEDLALILSEELYINEYGSRWYFDEYGAFHKDDDGAAIIYASGEKHWYKHGKQHRIDGPAITHANGTKKFWIEDKQVEPF